MDSAQHRARKALQKPEKTERVWGAFSAKFEAAELCHTKLKKALRMCRNVRGGIRRFLGLEFLWRPSRTNFADIFRAEWRPVKNAS